ncbi:MAG: endonuclease MutS2 [Oscillospiraceae bacterium]
MDNLDLTYRTRLEFDKICARVSELAISDEAKKRVLDTVPSTDVSTASEQLAITDSLFKMITANSYPSIASVDSISEICMRAQKGGVLSMGELLKIRTMLRNARMLQAWYSEELDEDGFTNRLFYLLHEDNSLEREINECILSDIEMSDDASSELREIRKKIRRAESSIREKLDSMIRSASTQKYLQDAIVTMRGGRFVVPVKMEYKNEVSGLVHDVSSSGSTYFVEPAAVVEANNLIMQLHGDELKEIDRILGAFTDRVGVSAEMLRNSYETFVLIDIALAKAKYAIGIDGTKPILNSDGIVDLQRARHPLISKKDVVPINISLGGEYTSLIITGPNTGGKTVTLKTVGLLTLMAMSGMLISAKENSLVCVFEKVLVDIGDEQSIEQSLSTFSSHIKNISEILKTADDKSLVLLDELGAGTDPAEGAALAVAILERLRGFGSRVLATTHYGEIKMYALETKGVQNASCEFDVATLRPTYKLNIGIPGRSNALLIGERLGLDKALLSSAKLNMSAQDSRFEEVLNEIERLKSELSQKQDEIESMRDAAQELIKKGKNEYDKLITQGKTELDAARFKAKQLVSDVTAGAYKLLDEIKLLDSTKEKDRQAAKMRAKAIANNDSAKLFDLADPVEAISAENLERLKSVKAGDSVYVVALGQSGVAIGPPDAKGSVEVKAGLLKTRVNIGDLRKPPQSKRTKAIRTFKESASVEEKRSGKNEINLIGMNVDEAVMQAEQFIDNAMLSNLSMVYLIHGKGTGALRNGIHQCLRKLKCVKSFRLGKYGEGEDGVTIVELK